MPTDPIANAAAERQAAQGEKVPPSTVRLRSLFSSGYKPGSGRVVDYHQFHAGSLQNIEFHLKALADANQIDIGDGAEISVFIAALVAEFYINGASDKFNSVGEITLDGLKDYKRSVIYEYINKVTGNHTRRFVRAFAPHMIAIIEDDIDTFKPMLVQRAGELGITWEQAIYTFDGADKLELVNPDLRVLNERNKVLKLRNSYPSTLKDDGLVGERDKYNRDGHSVSV